MTLQSKDQRPIQLHSHGIKVQWGMELTISYLGESMRKTHQEYFVRAVLVSSFLITLLMSKRTHRLVRILASIRLVSTRDASSYHNRLTQFTPTIVITGEYKEAIQFQCLERGGVRVFEGINFMSRNPTMSEDETKAMHARAERAGMYPYGT
jgi:hypothetical protein